MLFVVPQIDICSQLLDECLVFALLKDYLFFLVHLLKLFLLCLIFF